MKIICTQENLQKGLQTVGRIISPNNTLPILNNILIKTENGQLKISSTNLEIAIINQVRCKIEEEGEVTVFSKTISELVNNLPNNNVILENQEGLLKIEAENYHTNIKTLPAEEFPLIPSVENNNIIILDAQSLKKSIDQVVFAASTNQTQPEISGILLKNENGSLVVAATDRYRLAEKKIALKEKNAGFTEVIVPQKTILELSRILGSQKGEVEMVVTPTQIAFTFNQTQIISRLIEGQYPDYRQIIPSEFITTISTSKQALVNGLRAGGIFSQGSFSVKLNFNTVAQSLTIDSESAELGKSVVELPSEIVGESGEIILNYHYLLDCLSNMDCDKVSVKVINDTSPVIVLPQGLDDYLYLIMPIKS